MNYLAHAYLSFNQPEILVGNMISDFVKGRTKFDYPPGIQKGIALHRAIDAYTDGHEVVKELKAFFSPHYRLYAGAFTDVVFDHYLARQLNSQLDLKAFTGQVYSTLALYQPVFPPLFSRMFPGMQEHDWLFHYQFTWGIQRSFGGLRHRARYIEETETAFALFEMHYAALENGFDRFWPQLEAYAAHTLNRL